MTIRRLFLGTTESASLKAPIEILCSKAFKLGHRWILVCKLSEPIVLGNTQESWDTVYLVDRRQSSGETLVALNRFPYDCYVYYEVRTDKLSDLQKIGRNGILLEGKLYDDPVKAKQDIDRYQERYKQYF